MYPSSVQPCVREALFDDALSRILCVRYNEQVYNSSRYVKRFGIRWRRACAEVRGEDFHEANIVRVLAFVELVVEVVGHTLTDGMRCAIALR